VGLDMELWERDEVGGGEGRPVGCGHRTTRLRRFAGCLQAWHPVKNFFAGCSIKSTRQISRFL
jgi:hypothetical protein